MKYTSSRKAKQAMVAKLRWFTLLGICIIYLSNAPLSGAATADPTQASWLDRVLLQVTQVWAVAEATAEATWSANVLDVFRTNQDDAVTAEELAQAEAEVDTDTLFVSRLQPEAGSLLFNMPLRADILTVDTQLRAATSSLGATNISNLTAGPTSLGETGVTRLNVSTALNASAATLGVVDITTANVSEQSNLTDLTVAGATSLAGAEVNDLLRVTGIVEALAGIRTSGADIDAGSGNVYAANIVNQVRAGTNVIVSGSSSEPIISFDTDALTGVTAINDETGDLYLRGGSDIDVSSLRITNTSRLSTVRSRGGCVSCLTDSDIKDDLTISGGLIENTVIGSTTPAAATFSNLTVSSTATSTFSSTINLTDGCFAINGTCVGGLTGSTYVGLTDTPSSLIAGAIQYSNTAGDAVVNSSNLRFSGSNLQLGDGYGVAINNTPVLQASSSLDSLHLGWSAGSGNQGTETVLLGHYAGENNSADYLTAVGYGSAGNNQGAYNTALGYLAGYGMTGRDNVAIGASAASSMAGSYNIAIGTDAGLQADADWNTYIGFEAGRNAQGTSSVALGAEALRGVGVDAYNGPRNTALGYRAGYQVASSSANNVLLGYQAGANLTTGSNNIVIGYDLFLPDSTSSNTLTLGNLLYGTGLDAVGTSTASGSVGIGTSTPSSRLTVAGDIYTTGAWRDGQNSAGTSGDLLQSTGTSTVWANPTAFGLGDGSFLGLLDTPSSYATSALVYASSSAAALTQSSTFVFDGSRLGIGTANPGSTLSVVGDMSSMAGGALRLYDTDDSHYVGLRASTTVSTSTIWTLPPGDGTNNQLLVTDGDGQLRFADISAVGGGATNYLTLTDTPNSYLADSIPYVNAAGDALTQISDFVYKNDALGVGVSNPGSRLSVEGDVRFQASASIPGLVYDSVYNRIGIGTDSPDNMLSVQGGSITQRGGISGDEYTPTITDALGLGTSANDLALQGDYAFVVANNSTLYIIDITDPTAASVVNSVALTDSATAITISGQYAYLSSGSSGDEFHVVDISNPFQASEVGSTDLPAAAKDVAVQGKYAYVVTGKETGQDVVQVVNVSSSTAPQLVASAPLIDTGNAVAVAGDYLYVASVLQGDDFHIFDISDPLTLHEIGSVELSETANGIALNGRYAYVTSDASAHDLEIVDLSNPSTPTVVGGVYLGVGASDVQVAGRFAYVSSYSAGDDVHVIDISDATAPIEVGGESLGVGNLLGIALRGQYVYTVNTSSSNTFHTVDISGADIQSARVHALASGQLTVEGDTVVGGALQVRDSLRTGVGGIQTDGSLVAQGNDDSFIAGALGIGTSTPNTALTVDGTIRASNLYGGAVGLETDANGNIIRAVSDARLKTDVSTITGALDTVLNLRGVRYQWLDTERFGEQVEIGFLAQEVDTVLPEVVRKGGEYWSLNTRNIVAVVVESIKEMWSVVEGNQSEIATLQDRVAELEAELSHTSSPTNIDDTESHDSSDTDTDADENTDTNTSTSTPTLTATSTSSSTQTASTSSQTSTTTSSSTASDSSDDSTSSNSSVTATTTRTSSKETASTTVSNTESTTTIATTADSVDTRSSTSTNPE